MEASPPRQPWSWSPRRARWATRSRRSPFPRTPPLPRARVVVRPKSFAAEPSGGSPAEVMPITAPVDEKHRRARITDRVADVAAGPKLEEAPVVISGGRGLGDPKNFELLDQLAQALG